MAEDAPRPPLGSDGRPLRIVIIGSSAVFMMIPRSYDPDDGIYASLLPELLRQRGIVNECWVHSQWHGTIREVLPRYEGWVRDHLPDLVIVNLGMAEAQARVVPTWLLRHTQTWLPGTSRFAATYRRRYAPTVKRWVRDTQRALAPRVGPRASRVPPGQFVRAMERLVTLCTRDLGAHVLLLDIDPPDERIRHWMPGLDERVQRYNGLLAGIVGRHDRAHLVRTSQVVVAQGADVAAPDGLHRSALGHRLVAQMLAEAIAGEGGILGAPAPDRT